MGIQYLLPCSCGERRPVSPRQAGETVRCRCGALLQVPAMREIKKLERVGQSREASTSGQNSTWGRRESRIFLGALITATGLGLFAFTQMTRPRLSDIASLTPIQTWVLWQDLRNGPDRHLGQQDVQYGERCARNRVATIATLGLAASGIVLTVAASLMRKRRIGRRGARQVVAQK